MNHYHNINNKYYYLHQFLYIYQKSYNNHQKFQKIELIIYILLKELIFLPNNKLEYNYYLKLGNMYYLQNLYF